VGPHYLWASRKYKAIQLYRSFWAILIIQKTIIHKYLLISEKKNLTFYFQNAPLTQGVSRRPYLIQALPENC
jgi:hypothetical protein